MPNRILRPGILDSDRVNKLSWPAEVFYRRLMSVVDDHGRYDGRPTVLRAHLYPIALDRVSEADVIKWMRETAEAGLVSFYQVANKGYLQMLDFGQKKRSGSKWPEPVDECNQLSTSADNCAHLQTSADNCGHLQTSADNCRQVPTIAALVGGGDGDGDVKTLPSVESAPSCDSAPAASKEPSEGVLFENSTQDSADGKKSTETQRKSLKLTTYEFPCQGKTKSWTLPKPKFDEYKQNYPGLDVEIEIRKARQWAIDNPKRRKTANGMPSFLTSWLNRAVNRGVGTQSQESKEDIRKKLRWA